MNASAFVRLAATASSPIRSALLPLALIPLALLALCQSSPCQAGSAPQDPEASPAGRTSYLGREVAHTMHWKGAPWLMRQTREDEENGTLLRRWLKVAEGEAVCDFGCGNGYHTVPLAEAVGASGKMFAVDLQPQMLTMLRKRCDDRKLTNVEYIESTIDDPKLPAGSCDLILLVDVYHELSHPVRVMTRLREALKPQGRIVLVEFRKEDKSVPIKPEHTMTKAQVVREMARHGFALQSQFDELPWQHAMAFTRSDRVGERFEAQQFVDAFVTEVATGLPRQVRAFLAAGMTVDAVPELPAGTRSEIRQGAGKRLIAELQRPDGKKLPIDRDQVVVAKDEIGRWFVQGQRARQPHAYAHGSSRPFVPLHNALGGGPVAQRIARAPAQGFDGVAWSFEKLAAARAACEANGCDLHSAYTVLDLGDGVEQRLEPIRAAMRTLRGGPAMIWLGLQYRGQKPRDPAGDAHAARILQSLLKTADETGVEISLYPHHRFWMETAEDALRLCERVRHPRLGLCFNVCHFLSNHTETDPRPLLRRCAKHLFAVTVCGANVAGEGWNELIQPLDQGDFDLKALLAVLDDIGFRGQVGLQAYGIRKPWSQHLPASMKAWQAAHVR